MAVADIAPFQPAGQVPLAAQSASLLSTFTTSTAPSSLPSHYASAAPLQQSAPEIPEHAHPSISVHLQPSNTQPGQLSPSASPRPASIFSAVLDSLLQPFRQSRTESATPTQEEEGKSAIGDAGTTFSSAVSAAFWSSGVEDPELWSREEKLSREIPQYVFDYAPYVHLFSGEEFWPCDIAEHLLHTTPHVNFTPIERMRDDRKLNNLDELNQFGRHVFLKSDDDVEGRPEWLGGSRNIPETSDGLDGNNEDQDWSSLPPHQRDRIREQAKTARPQAGPSGGHSSAPAVLVLVPKDNGIVDAFWFYFYSYNLGNKVVWRFGNHVGDWEHTVVRFKHGEPQYIFLSEHNFGEAYSYQAMEKIGKRPVTFSATGSHAMYAVPGLHPYVLPWGVLHDETDRGPLWDPLLNSHAFTYNLSTSTLRASTRTPKAPTEWFHFAGHWGDKSYPLTDRRQYTFAGQYHYVSGPLGPRFKNLGRKRVCQGGDECVIKHWLGGGRTARSFPIDGGRGEEMDDEMAKEAGVFEPAVNVTEFTQS